MSPPTPSAPAGSGRPKRPSGTLPSVIDTVPVPRIELAVEREAGLDTGRRIIIDGELCRIGSNPSNDLVLSDPHVSQFHCRLTRGESGWRVNDSGSLNGIRLDGVRVRDADLLMPECVLSLGGSRVRVVEKGSVVQASVPVWPSFGALVGTSLPMRTLFGVLARVAKSEATVLIEGESGTGKEIIATEIVQRSARSERPLVIVDCGAVSPSLIESELFGHVRGAFTGADRDRQGAFEAADGGTVFLDEVGEMPLELQPMLVRALEAREVRRVGETRTRKIDVRVIAATNRRLEREVNHRRFREDLFFRLSVVTVRVPPLREHLTDLPDLVSHFLRSMDALEHRGLFTTEVLQDLQRYDWPGNVRELRNYVERTIVLEAASPARRRLSSFPEIAADSEAQVNIELPFKTAKDEVTSRFEKKYLEALLLWAGGNVSMAARKAGLDRMYVHRLLQKHGIALDGTMKG